VTGTAIDGDSKAPSPTWCALPWMHLFVGENGTMRPCCMALENPGMVNRDSEGVPLTAYDGVPLEQSWNSPFMRKIRQEMLSGQRPPACARCFREEDLGMRSERQTSNDTFAAGMAEAVAATGTDGWSSADRIRSLDIRLGNRCNLKCRMCSPVSSRATRADYAALHGIEPDHPRLVEQIGPEDWMSSKAFLDLFEACSAGADRIQFSGGEPLLIPEMKMLLQGLVDRGLASGIDLYYISNLTTLPKALFPLWQQFRRVSFLVSLDAIEAEGEYIRNNLNWPRLALNLRLLDAKAEEIGCRKPRVNVTVQAYNVLGLDKTVAYVAQNLPHFGRPNLSLLYYPEHLGVRVLPPGLKRIATERLLRLADRVRGGWPGQWTGEEADDLLLTIDGIVEHMNGADRTDLLDEFRRWTRILDDRRGEDVRLALPELGAIFELEAVAEGVS
jgi:hypothetical protein